MKQNKYWPLCLAIWLGIASPNCAQNKNSIELMDHEKLIKFTTDRFTLPNLHVTPDRKSIIFDVLGDIYQVPIKGGKAEILLQDNNWKRAGKLSPDAKTLAYVSDETGEFQVWTYDLITKLKKNYPVVENLHATLYPYWSHDMKLLIPSKKGLFSFDVNTGKGDIIRKAMNDEKSITHRVNRNMFLNKPGTTAFFQKDGALWAHDLIEQQDRRVTEIPDKTYISFLQSNGEQLIFYRKNKSDGSNQDLVYWNLELNNIKTLNITRALGNLSSLNFGFDFIDDNTIVLDKEGIIVRMNIKTGKYEPIPIEVEVKKVIKKPLQRKPQYIRDSIITASVLRNPVTQNKLDTIFFGAFGKLHSYAKETGTITELYPKEDRLEVSPSLSPDGKYLAYTTWNDWEMGHLYVREIKTGKENQITKNPGRYINPAWSPDGTEIVFAADETEAKMGISSQRSSGAPKYLVYNIDVHMVKAFDGKSILKNQDTHILKTIYPSTNLPRRFYPTLMYHPNGKSVFMTTRNNEKDLSVIIQVDLKTKETLKETLIPFHIDEALVSPDAKHTAFIFDEQVWVDSYPYTIELDFFEGSEFVPEEYHYKGGFPENVLFPHAKSVYEVAPSYLSWQDKYTLMWGSAEEVYTYDTRTGITKKIADIKVQKSREVPQTRYALTNAHIITMNKQDEIIEKGTILLKNNRIEAVGKDSEIMIPENYKIFDLEGKTIMPGLIDVHAHYHLFPYEFQVQQNYKYIGNLAYGVTTIYDPSVNVLDYREQAQRVEIGSLLGPRVFASGNIIYGQPGKGQYAYKNIQNYTDALTVVKGLKKIGTHGPIKEYEIKSSLVRGLLRKAAFKEEMTITSHQNNYLRAMSRVINGYSAIEHEIGGFPLQLDAIETISQSGIHYTPTYIVRPGIKDIYVDRTRQEENKLLNFNGETIYHNYYRFSYGDRTIENINKLKNWSISGVREHERAIGDLKRINSLDGKISVGGHGNPLPGIGTHWEIWFMTKAVTNYEALQAATLSGAEKLDLQEELGSIEESKLADLIVLNSNPLEDIFNTTDLHYTIQNGNIYDAETMKQIHPNQQNIRPWGWDSPTILQSMQYIQKNKGF